MSDERFYEIIKYVDGLKTEKEKIAFLDSVIESTDYCENGNNGRLIDMRNKLNDLAKKNGSV